MKNKRTNPSCWFEYAKKENINPHQSAWDKINKKFISAKKETESPKKFKIFVLSTVICSYDEELAYEAIKNNLPPITNWDIIEIDEDAI